MANGRRRQVVPAHLPDDLREPPVDLVGTLLDHRRRGAVDLALARPQFQLALILGRRQRAERRGSPVGQHRRQRPDMIDRLAVHHRPRAGRVVADHPAKRRPAGGRHVRPELQPVLADRPVQVVEYHSRLHPDPPSGDVHLADVVEVLRAVQNDARSDGLAREAGATAARGDGDLQLGGDLHRGRQVVGRLRHDDAKRLDLVEAGVGGVEPARGVVKANLTGNVPAQVTDQGIPADGGEVGHGGILAADESECVRQIKTGRSGTERRVRRSAAAILARACARARARSSRLYLPYALALIGR